MQNKDIKVVIGANFGDEGKGLMTSFFCNQASSARVLNVRFNGGSQAGHTVLDYKDNGTKGRHVYHMYGSGSFNEKVDTYITQHAVVNPIMLSDEFEELATCMSGNQKMYINSNAIVTTPYDMMSNQIIEGIRGNRRHGSCGCGIFETITRCKNSNLKLTYRDLVMDIEKVRKVCNILRKSYVIERVREAVGVKCKIPDSWIDILNNDKIVDAFINDCETLVKRSSMVNEVPDCYDTYVFEGAQGLMLDQNNMEYYPHLTPSNTGMKNVCDVVKELRQFGFTTNTEVCYVTRAYLTRHGAGKFVTECSIDNIGDKIVEETNVTNEYQGNFRYGLVHLGELANRLQEDYFYAISQISESMMSMSLAVTHLDETNDKIMLYDGTGVSVREAVDRMNKVIGYECIKKVYMSHSPETCNIERE